MFVIETRRDLKHFEHATLYVETVELGDVGQERIPKWFEGEEEITDEELEQEFCKVWLITLIFNRKSNKKLVNVKVLSSTIQYFKSYVKISETTHRALLRSRKDSMIPLSIITIRMEEIMGKQLCWTTLKTKIKFTEAH